MERYSTMNKKQTAAFKKEIVTATTDATKGFLLVKVATVAALVTDGLIEVNTSIAADANGLQPARATAKLIAELATPAAPAAAVVKPVFELVSGIVPVAGLRGGVKEEVYPFSKMEIGISFVVPVNEKSTTAEAVVEKFSSTVSSATRRFAVKSETETRKNAKGELVPKMVPTRKFTLRPVLAGTKYDNGFVEPVSGARVFRIA